jgi:tetratricopeptide (TPR) repeat protein
LKRAQQHHKHQRVGGAFWRYGKACLLVWQAKKGKKETLDETRALLDGVAAERPGWSRVAVCMAEIDQLKGDPARAIRNYQRAITELGDRNHQVMRQLVQLLYERRRYAEADQALRKLPEEALLSPDFQRLTASVAFQTHDYERAESLSRKAVDNNSRDYHDHLWLGMILSGSSKNRAEAEKAFRQTVGLADTNPETWVALVGHLAACGEKDRARAEIQEAQRRFPREAAGLALARCFEEGAPAAARGHRHPGRPPRERSTHPRRSAAARPTLRGGGRLGAGPQANAQSAGLAGGKTAVLGNRRPRPAAPPGIRRGGALPRQASEAARGGRRLHRRRNPGAAPGRRGGKGAEVVTVLEGYVANPQGRPAALTTRQMYAAGMLAELSRRYPREPRYAAAAAALYRKYVDQVPDQSLLLASFLARQGRPGETLPGERAWRTNAPEAVANAASRPCRPGRPAPNTTGAWSAEWRPQRPRTRRTWG